MTRLLVCGGRDYTDANQVFDVLESIHAETPISVIIHGAAKGADSLAGLWADVNDIEIDAYPADWKTDGKAAGPIRNNRMLKAGNPDKVLAFPGGKGTAHMVSIAKKAGIEILTHTHQTT